MRYQRAYYLEVSMKSWWDEWVERKYSEGVQGGREVKRRRDVEGQVPVPCYLALRN